MMVAAAMSGDPSEDVRRDFIRWRIVQTIVLLLAFVIIGSF
jgi:hypothetical protein